MIKMGYVLVDDIDTNSYRTGFIVERIGAEHMLIQFDNMSVPERHIPAELFHISEMTTVNPHGFKVWGFFTTREELEKHVEYLDSPSKPNVVSLVTRNQVER
jgi:hypothetical protein